MSRVMFCPEKLKFYTKQGNHRNYDCHSETLENLLAKEQVNTEYRDSAELAWLKYCVKAQDNIINNGLTNKRGINRYHYHDVIKRFPKLIQAYHHFLLAENDRDKARESTYLLIREQTNKTAQMLGAVQKGAGLVAKMCNFINGLEWFEYKSLNTETSDLDKMLSFVARYEAASKKGKKTRGKKK